jgi:hypothetical protein
MSGESVGRPAAPQADWRLRNAGNSWDSSTTSFSGNDLFNPNNRRLERLASAETARRKAQMALLVPVGTEGTAETRNIQKSSISPSNILTSDDGSSQSRKLQRRPYRFRDLRDPNDDNIPLYIKLTRPAPLQRRRSVERGFFKNKAIRQGQKEREEQVRVARQRIREQWAALEPQWEESQKRFYKELDETISYNKSLSGVDTATDGEDKKGKKSKSKKKKKKNKKEGEEKIGDAADELEALSVGTIKPTKRAHG